MRLLADESCDFAVVRALRNAGFDAVAIIEVAPGAEDAAVIDRAIREGRMLITEDKDFGRFVYADERHTAGVMLLRFPATARANIASTVVELIGRRGERLEGGLLSHSRAGYVSAESHDGRLIRKTVSFGCVMPKMGIRELKIRASEIVRSVREGKVQYIITHRVALWAVLGPAEGTPLPEAGTPDASAWQQLEQLGRRSAKAGGRGRTVQTFSQNPAAERREAPRQSHRRRLLRPSGPQ